MVNMKSNLSVNCVLICHCEILPFSLYYQSLSFPQKERKIIKNLATNSDEEGVYVKTIFEIIRSHNDKIALFVKNNTV